MFTIGSHLVASIIHLLQLFFVKPLSGKVPKGIGIHSRTAVADNFMAGIIVLQNGPSQVFYTYDGHGDRGIRLSYERQRLGSVSFFCLHAELVGCKIAQSDEKQDTADCQQAALACKGQQRAVGGAYSDIHS